MKDYFNKSLHLFSGNIFQEHKNDAEEQFDEVKSDSYSNHSRVMKRRKLKGKVRNSIK